MGQWLAAVLALAPLLVVACGGNAALRAEPEPVEEAPEPSPADPIGTGNAGVGESSSPVVPEGTPDDISVDPTITPPEPPPRECPWVRRGVMPEGRVGMGFAELGGRVYLFGGLSKAQFDQGPIADDPVLSALNVYDAATDDWSQRGAMPIDSGDVSAVTVGDVVYVFAGLGAEGIINRSYRYDPELDSWLERAPMRVNRSQFTTVAVGSKVYLIGGSGPADDGSDTSNGWLPKSGLEIYDTVSDSWSAGAQAPGASAFGAACALGSRIFVFDGTVSGATYIYDTVDDSWSEGARAPEGRNWASCVTRGDHLLLMGGRATIVYDTDPKTDGPTEFRGTIESSTLIQAYFPDTDSWQDGGRLLRAREQFAVANIDGEVHVIGGAESHTKDGPQGTFVLDEVTVMTDTFCEVR